MRAHVLLNLLNELGERYEMRRLLFLIALLESFRHLNPLMVNMIMAYFHHLPVQTNAEQIIRL